MSSPVRYIPRSAWRLAALLSVCVTVAAVEFDPPELRAMVEVENLTEASGLAASRVNPGVLWAHNDNAVARLYAVNLVGRARAVLRLRGVADVDFEDIAVGPGLDPELPGLYVGDIGDNSLSRDAVRLFLVHEPAVYPADVPVRDETVTPARSWTLRYPDEARFDAEGLLVDPDTGDVAVITKENGRAQVFTVARAALIAGQDATLQFAADVPFAKVSAADVSPDGRWVVLRREESALMWPRAAGQSWAEVFAGEPSVVPVVGPPSEPNGEGIAFQFDGVGLYTISEGREAPLYFLRRTDAARLPRTRWLVPAGTPWHWLDTGTDAGTAWREPAFNDAAWPRGPAPLGYGEDDEATLVSAGPAAARHVTTYFRTAFVWDGAAPVSAGLRVQFDDGVAVSLNGVEIFRRGLAADAAHDTPATASAEGLENLWHSAAFDPALLRPGTNVLAAEVHRFSRSEAGLTFDAQLFVTEQPLRVRLGIGGGGDLAVESAHEARVQLEQSADLRTWSPGTELVLPSGHGTVPTGLPAAGGSFWRAAEPSP